ncbi:hypothetical protein D9M69_730260 [compost metagenome]
MIERCRICSVKYGSGCTGYKAINDNRNFLHACSKNCTCHGSDLTSAQTTQNFQRIFKMCLMKC